MASHPPGAVSEGHIGWRLHELRNQRGVSQAWLAEALGVSVQQIAKYESGQDRVSLSRAFQIADAFRTSVEVFR